MEQFKGQLAGADVELDQAVLDRIDEIVAPGTTINPVDDSFSLRRWSRLRADRRTPSGGGGTRRSTR